MISTSGNCVSINSLIFSRSLSFALKTIALGLILFEQTLSKNVEISCASICLIPNFLVSSIDGYQQKL
jgi:hypothetical protein